MAPSPVEELALLDLDRSNKGASKQRRDQINAEIAIMRDLLPLPESSRQRLSQLQIMSLCCVYIRKCNTLQKMFRTPKPLPKDTPSTFDFFQAMTGFLLITTREGKLIYISENVTDYLGHSMVDMKTQGNSLYDIVDKRDHGTVQTQLLQGGAEVDLTRDVAFFCRMNMSRSLKRQAGFGDVKVMHVKGHFCAVPDSEGSEEVQYVFTANCTPLITPDLKETLIQNNTMVFKTVHQLDMAFLEISQTAEHHLGYSNDEIFHKSWYSLIHPEDIHDAKEKHMQLIRSNHEIGCMVTLRLVRADCSQLWVNVVMQVRQGSAQSDDPVIVCANQIISEEEAYQFKVQSPMFHYPGNGTELWSPMVPCSMAGQEQDNRWMSHTQTGYNTAGFARGGGGGGSGGGGRLAFYHPTVNQPVPGSPYVDVHMRHGGDSLSVGGAAQQTETLKDILRRKIKGPCRPAKVPRLSPQDSEDKKDNLHFDLSLEESFSRSLESFHGGMGGLAVMQPQQGQHQHHHQQQQGWSDPVCVPAQTSYRSSALSHKAGVLVEPGWMTPPHCSPTSQGEQVVPDMAANLPESYLTPDPSPASSPDPQGGLGAVTVKTERDCGGSSSSGSDCSMALLEQLSKMVGKTKMDVSETATATNPQQQQQLPRARPATASLPPQPRSRELPVIDANEIDDFFENLNSPPAISCSSPASAAAAATITTTTTKPKAALDAARLACIKKEPGMDVKPPVFRMRPPVVGANICSTSSISSSSGSSSSSAALKPSSSSAQQTLLTSSVSAAAPPATSTSVPASSLVDEVDLGDIEEFFNNVILDFDYRSTATTTSNNNNSGVGVCGGSSGGNFALPAFFPQMEVEPQVQTASTVQGGCCQQQQQQQAHQQLLKPRVALAASSGGVVGVRRSGHLASPPAACSPGSQGSPPSELSEEEEELLEEFSNDAIGMTLSVTVANVGGQGLQGAAPAALPGSSSAAAAATMAPASSVAAAPIQTRPEDELSQLNRLLYSLVPASSTSQVL